MVNTGHPSRACKLCRTRRIKCDETKPFCNKCKKSKRQCPGYRDPFEIKLRDETQSTIRKAKATQRKGRAMPDKESSPDDEPVYATSGSNKYKSHQRKESSSTILTDVSWETIGADAWPTTEPIFELASNWSSPASAPATLEKPLLSAGMDTWDFGRPVSASFALEPEFDFNSTWSLPQARFAVPIKRVCEELSKWDFNSTLNGTMWSFGEAAEDGSDSNQLARHVAVPSGLQTPLDEQATCFFLSNFVLEISDGQSPGLFSFVLSVLQSPGIKNTPFPMAFAAVSLAALAGRPNSRHLIHKSRIYYSTALVQLKEVLKSKRLAKNDTSLATALLMSFYEVGTFTPEPLNP